MNAQDTLPQPAIGFDHEEILAEYRQRCLVEHVAGPLLSLLLHAVVVLVCAMLLVGRQTTILPIGEISLKPLDIKEFDPKIEEQVKLDEDLPITIVPTVVKPEISSDPAEIQVDDLNQEMPGSEMEIDVPSDVKMTEAVRFLPTTFVGRERGKRGEVLREYVGDGPTGVRSEKALLKALRWLKEHQEADGSWSPQQYPEAMTGLALMAFLGHDETHRSEEFGPTVMKAMQWLTNTMLAKGKPGRGYCHGIATYALAEAYGMTGLPFVKPAMDKGLAMILDGQQPRGGFDYNFARGERWDLSVAAWQLQALKAGYVSGSAVPGLAEGMRKGIEFVKTVAYKDGRFGYAAPGNGSLGMQGAGTLCLQLLGEARSSEARICAEQTLAPFVPEWKDSGNHPCYAWYYVNQALFHHGKQEFKNWYPQFVAMLYSNQFEDGHWETPPGGKKGERPSYDPYLNTAMNALSLEVTYRYLPSYKAPSDLAKAKTSPALFADDEG